MHYLYNLNGAREWYYSLPLFYAAFYILPFITISNINYKSIWLPVLSILVFYFFIYKNEYYDMSDAYVYSKIINETVPPSKIIFQVDYSGLVGFFSERKVINGDGLINSFEYSSYLKNNDLKSYFNIYPIDYYSTYAYSNPIKDGIFMDKLFTPGGYKFIFPEKNIIIQSKKSHGGFFRRRLGTFYLIKVDN